MKLQWPLCVLLTFFSLSLVAQKAPDFMVVTTNNKTINLYDDFLNQGQAVVIELFFVDCPSCRTFAPFISNLHKKMVAQEVAVDFISLSVFETDNDETVNEFKEMFDHDWYFAHAGGNSFSAAEPYQDGTFGTYFGTPTIVVIAPDGTVNYIKRVFGDNDAYINNIETAIMEAQVVINDNAPPTAIVSGAISTTVGDGLSGVEIKFTGATDTTIISDDQGQFQTGSLLANENYTVSLEKTTNAVNGVTTLDIVLVSKQILGIETFTTNHQQIAADVNRSGAVTTFDIVQMRQLILGINDNFANAPSWIFEPSEIAISSLSELGNLSFTGIKIGDLNGSANPNGLLALEERNSQAVFTLSARNQEFKAGETVLLTLNATDLSKIQGYQFSLGFDPTVLTLNGITESDLHQLYGGYFNLRFQEEGMLSTSWDKQKDQIDKLRFTLPFKAKKAGVLSEVIDLNSTLTRMEAFDLKEELLAINLTFEPANTKMENDISLFPNPTRNESTLKLNLEKTENIEIIILNIAGQIIDQSIHQVLEGEQLLKLSTAHLPTGVYTVTINCREKIIESIPMIKY
ncbi:MAG: T9SS type A sorting domain-containing protein [Saprospiraceae bacterium]